MQKENTFNVGIRLWSKNSELDHLYSQYSNNIFRYYKKGDYIKDTKGNYLKVRSEKNYIAFKDDVFSSGDAVMKNIFDKNIFIRSIMELKIDDLEIYLWISIFGDEYDISNLNYSAFSKGIGIIIENYTMFDQEGNPVKSIIEHSQNKYHS